MYAYSLHLKIHHLALNYSMLEKIFQQDYAVKISLFVHSHRNPKTKHWVSSFREKTSLGLTRNFLILCGLTP